MRDVEGSSDLRFIISEAAPGEERHRESSTARKPVKSSGTDRPRKRGMSQIGTETPTHPDDDGRKRGYQ